MGLKDKKQPADQSEFSHLRKEAELFLSNKDLSYKDKIAEDDIKKLFQELQVHQIELEMQNDELRRANEELEIERLRFSGIYDLAPVGYFIMDMAGKVEDVNITGATLLGRQKSRIINFKLQSFIIPECIDEFYIFLNNLNTTNTQLNCQLKFFKDDAVVIDAQVEGITINNTLSLKKQCYIAVMDITKRIISEQQLSEIKNRLELALEASHAGTWEYDLRTGLFSMDDANYNICGLDITSFNGQYRSFIDIIHPDDRQKLDSALRTAVNQEKELNVDCRILRGEVACYISIRGHVVTERGKNKRFLGTMTDITEKKILEMEADQLKIDQHKRIAAAIFETEENERRRISELLHDSVSQLLYGIKLNLQQLKADKENDDALATINSLLNDAVKETRNISFELAPSVLTDFGLPATIEELAKRFSTPKLRIKTKMNGLKTRLSLTIEIVIFRLIQELLNNCIKHSGADTVIITIKKSKLLEIEVKDNGVGFNVNEQYQIPSGSGLSSIRNRLNFYNGTMRIKSQPGDGTIVNISLKL
ncbi:MAG: domain S-box protein [Mucilaginibacter sp.]|nr:domain S-box protein [Mucilaginibacter sp.]